METKISIANWIGIYGAFLATVLLILGVIRGCRERQIIQHERSKIVVNMHHLTLNIRDKNNTYHMTPILVTNLGRESVIIKQAIARGDGWSSHSGWYKEPDAAYGYQRQILPKELKLGESVEIHSFYLIMFYQHEVEQVAVIDADENEYYVSKHDLDMMHRRAKEIFASLEKESEKKDTSEPNNSLEPDGLKATDDLNRSTDERR